MPRIALGIEYDGSSFHGWQIQRGARTVQESLEKALGCVAAEAITVQCAGRTDCGVHALGQVVHFETEAVRDDRSWLLGTNSNLPQDVSVTWAREVTAEFHARYSALRRTYQYLILERPTRAALWRHRALVLRSPLNHERMQNAGRSLLGEHDFSAYRAAGCQSQSSVRTLHRLDVTRRGPWLAITVTANAFLQHMVRNLVGVLIAIGRGDKPPGWAHEVLMGRDRTRGGVTAVPDGLYLIKVEYPPCYKLPTPLAQHEFPMSCEPE